MTTPTLERKPPREIAPGEDLAAFCRLLYPAPAPDAGRIDAARELVRRHVTVPLHAGEFDALTILFLDAGEGRRAGTATADDLGRDGVAVSATGARPEILTLLNAGDYAGAGAQLPRWQAPQAADAMLIRRRRTCSVLLWEGLPWRWAAEATRQNPVLSLADARRVAEREREHLTAPKAVDAPPAAASAGAAPVETFTRSPAPDVPPEVEAAREAAIAAGLRAPVVTMIVEPPARISPNTKRIEEVEYNLDPTLGLKPLDESERVDGLVWQRVAKWGVKFSAFGGFGSLGVNVSQALDAQDVNLIAAGLDAAADAAWFGGTYAVSWVAGQYGAWKRKRGEIRARQGLY